MLVQTIMHRPTFVEPEATIEAVAELMAYKDIGSVIAGSPDRPLGIFSERDILKKIVAKGLHPKRTRVREHMSSPIITIEADKTVYDAMRIMTDKHVKRLPVVRNGVIVGTLSARSVMECVSRTVVWREPVAQYNNYLEETPSFW